MMNPFPLERTKATIVDALEKMLGLQKKTDTSGILSPLKGTFLAISYLE